MSVFVPVVNGLQVNMQFASAGDTNENVFWVKNTAAWNAATIKTMLDAFITWFGTGDGTHSYKSNMSEDVILTSVNGRDNTTQAGLVVIDQAGLPITGGTLVGQIQLGCSKSFTARTGLAGKSYRGRMFFCGVPNTAEDNADTGLVKAAWITTVLAALNTLPAAVTSAIATCSLVVCSRYYQPGGPRTATVPRATGLMTPITVYGNHDLNVDFQRRRAPGHGRHG